MWTASDCRAGGLNLVLLRGRGLELHDEFSGYPAAVFDLDALAPGPVADLDGVRGALAGLAAGPGRGACRELAWLRRHRRRARRAVPEHARCTGGREKTDDRTATASGVEGSSSNLSIGRCLSSSLRHVLIYLGVSPGRSSRCLRSPS
jgi:hypothetical protein